MHLLGPLDLCLTVVTTFTVVQTQQNPDDGSLYHSHIIWQHSLPFKAAMCQTELLLFFNHIKTIHL